MHWPDPPNPAEYPSPGLGLVLGLCAIVVIFVVAAIYAAQSNAPLLHKPELDEQT
jgi:uncharacterized membrane protein (DUF485 family)